MEEKIMKEKNSFTKKVFTLQLLFSLFCLSAAPVQAAVPTLMSYQGILKDSSGNFLTGTYSMTFRVYSASTGGTALWTETQSSVSVASGKFSVQLGSVTALNLTFNQDYWLSLQVGTDAEMSPRIKLTSAGYAYMAENVNNSFTQSQHDGLSHKNIEGVKDNTVLIGKTNFKIDALTSGSANSMGDMVIDTFSDSTGIASGSSSNYTWRGASNYDVVVTPTGGGNDSYTKLLLHFNGTNGSTTFTDASGSAHSVTANGSAQISTAQSKFSGASGVFDGSSYLTIPSSTDFDLGTGDFTIDFWARFNGSPGAQVFVDRGNGQAFAVRRGGDGVLKFENAGNEIGVSWSPNASQWYHIAVTRAGSTVRVFVDGAQVASGTNSNNITGTQSLYVGQFQSWGNPFNGWMDELRISKGIARWTSNFTPPASEYSSPQSSGTATVVSVAYSEPAPSTEALVIADETLNGGTITYYISRDNGVNWTQCAKETLCSISSQPSGTQLKWKAVITNAAELNGIAVGV